MEKTTTHSNSLSSEASPDKDQELPHLRHRVKKKKSKHPLVVNLLGTDRDRQIASIWW